MNASATGQVVGYNHSKMVWPKTEHYKRFIKGNTDINTLRPNDVVDVIRENTMIAAPAGLQ